MITAADVVHDLEQQCFAAVSQELGEKTALACADALFDCLYLNFKGQNLYIPTIARDANKQRYEAIWEAFDGRNINELAVQYRLSIQSIYNITRAMRKRKLAGLQGDLFGAPPPPEPAKPLTLEVFDELLPPELTRAGYPAERSRQLARMLSDYLCQRYPGLLLRISGEMRKQRGDHRQDSIF